MWPYVSLTTLVGAATLFDKTKYQKLIFILISLLMILFSGLRMGGTGTGDYDAYLALYSVADNFDEVVNPTIHAEIGFRFLSYIGNLLGFGGQFIIFSMAALSFVLVARVIYKLSRIHYCQCWFICHCSLHTVCKLLELLLRLPLVWFLFACFLINDIRLLFLFYISGQFSLLSINSYFCNRSIA